MGVYGEIHSKVVHKLDIECRILNGCEVGEVKITKGYDLEVSYIIHTVGPMYYNPEWSIKNNYLKIVILTH